MSSPASEPLSGPSPSLPSIEGFEILARVGSGATGVVFKARDLASGRTVALKLLHPELARDRRFLSRLRREARVSSVLDHGNVARGLRSGETGGVPYLVLEFVEGKSLKTVLRERGALPEGEVLSIGRQIAEALAHAHAFGVVHRDVKPGNVILEPSGRARLTDFGLARAPHDASITREGATLGTPQYLAPEQARDVRSASPRSDLYGLGATLFHAATGAPPFEGERIADVLTKVLFESAPDPATRNPDLSPGLCLVLRKLLLKDPKRRYASGEDLLADLRAVEHRQAPSVHPSSLLEEPRRPAGGGAKAAFAAGLLVLGGVAFLLLSPRRGEVPVLSAQPVAAESVGAEIAQALASPRRILSLLRLRALLARPDLAPPSRVRVQSALDSIEPLAKAEFERAGIAAAAKASEAAEKGRFGQESTVFEQEIPDAVQEILGAPVESFPADHAERWEALLKRLRIVFREKGEAAGRAFRVDLEGTLERVRSEVRVLARAGRYRTALERLEEGVASFRDAAGRRAEDLLPADRESARSAVESFRKGLAGEVEADAARRGSEAASVARELAVRFEKDLAARKTTDAAAAFDRDLGAALDRRGIDPAELLPLADLDFGAQIEGHRRSLVRLESEQAATAAVGRWESLEGDLEVPLGERRLAQALSSWKRHLEDPSLASVYDRIRARLVELEVLESFRVRFAERIDAAVGEPIELRSGGIVHSGKVSRRYDRERDTVEILPAGRPALTLPFRDLHPDSIDRVLGFVDPATGGDLARLSSDDRFARALFRFRCGDPENGERLLRSLTADPRAAAALGKPPAKTGPANPLPRGERALETIRQAREAKAAGALEAARAAYDRALGEFADTEEVKAQADALRREREEVRAGLERRARAERLRALAPGAKVEWEGDRPVLSFAFEEKVSTAWKVPNGWSSTPTGLRRKAAEVEGLADAPGPRLDVPLDGPQGYGALFSVQFPFESGDPPVVAFAAGTHSFVVRARGAGRGTEVAHGEGSLDAAEDSLRGRGPRAPRRIALAFAGGARYEVRLEVEPGGKRARLVVDGVEWGAGGDGAREASGVEVRSIGGAELRSVRVMGVLEGKPGR